MKRYRKNILILTLVVIVTIIASYFLYTSGTTNKIKANLNKLNKSINKDANISDYPIITMVINSSGEKLVNDDVALTVMAQSNYKIDKIYYSYDKKNWRSNTHFASYGKNANIRLLFTKSMDERVYIKVENERGYQSYVYFTSVKIDKKKPKLDVNISFDGVNILASDNIGLSAIQYSNDKVNWDEEKVSGKQVSLAKNNFSYCYIRAIDAAGNISKVKMKSGC